MIKLENGFKKTIDLLIKSQGFEKTKSVLMKTIDKSKDNDFILNYMAEKESEIRDHKISLLIN